MPSHDRHENPQFSGVLASHADVTGAAPRMRADARRNRERIVQAAREVFAAGGMEAQMDDVAAAAGVGVGTVYRHFPNKDALVGQLLIEKFERIMSVLEEAKTHGGDPGEALLSALEVCAGTMDQDLATQHVVSGPQKPAVWAAAAPTVQRLNAISAEMIAAGQATGTLRSDLQVTDIRLMMSSVAATMADPSLAPLWRRHVALISDSFRARAAGE